MASVQPLRISKNNTPASSPNKMAPARPLSEIASTERRRNSPSYDQATRRAIVSTECSPYVEDPSHVNLAKSSPRDFWQGRNMMSPTRLDSENTPDTPPSPSSPRRRPSIERLAQASRVKNSNIFALENKDVYDPASPPIVERPVANRPLSQAVANNTFTRYDSSKKENNPYRSPQRTGHKRTESETNVPLLTPSKSAALVPLPPSPEKQEPQAQSPTKSSLARTSKFSSSESAVLDQDGGDWSEADDRSATPRTLHRHAKSVTFHQDPPVINEYEQQTPEPSLSIASDREGSWDSDDYYDQDVSFDRGSSADPEREDSFDADLENADKTPVVLPEEWSRMSPDEARTDLVDMDDDVFEDSDEATQRPILGRDESVTSDSDLRPLPPIPGFVKAARRDSDSLTHAAERASSARRSLPSTPKRASCSKDDILNMTQRSSLTLEDRLRLMGVPDTEKEQIPSKTSEETIKSTEDEVLITNLDTGDRVQVKVSEKEILEDSELSSMPELDKAAPRISRESILRKVRNSKYDFEDESDLEDSEINDDPPRPSIADLAHMHPDQPIPSRETSRDTSDNQLARTSLDDDSRDEVIVKEEPRDDDEFDMKSIPAISEYQPRSPSRMDDYDRQSSVLRYDVPRDTDSERDDDSRYSSLGPDAEGTPLRTRETPDDVDGKETLQDAMGLLTVKDYTEPSVNKEAEQNTINDEVGLPTYFAADNNDFGTEKYLTPCTPPVETKEAHSTLDTASIPELLPSVEQEDDIGQQEDSEPAQESAPQREVSPPGTPSSVLHHASEDEPVSPLEDYSGFLQEPLPHDSPSVPERQATIRTGGKLKTRKSVSQADIQAMAEQRRIASSEYPVPAIPAEYEADFENPSPESEVTTADSSESSESKADSIVEEEAKSNEFKARRKSRKSGGRMDLALDTSAFSVGDQDGLCLDEEFDRVIESQKVRSPCPPTPSARFDAALQHQQEPQRSRYILCESHSPSPSQSLRTLTDKSRRLQKGYLMRQNTKVVVASNRNVSGESNDASEATHSAAGVAPMSQTNESIEENQSPSKANQNPRKASGEQYFKTEPWNGKTRRKSVRNASAQKTMHKSEPAPPLPGKESALGTVSEDYAAGNLEDEVPEGVERGRLFVKVVGIKSIDLPLPKNDRTYFQLTLDNGLHCVTTSSLELGRTASIGQEFELVVLNDLEFQLTLAAKLPPPPPVQTPSISSPVKVAKNVKQSGFSRLLSSPKKRAEKERQEREALQLEEKRLQEEARRKRASVQPTAWDLLHELVSDQDGSFARAYVNLKAYEKSCFGRQLTVDVPCYNEWALEKDVQVLNSVRSKRGNNTGPIRRPPYIVGHLELQLLYVPKPKGTGDASMPKSMSSAIREMNKASDVKEVFFEGHLSQQGGDCSHWRRRFFRIQGPRLTAYHEHTHQKRAVINLSKASRLVDDKSTLIADPTSSKSSSKSSRRKSAFAEEDEGYQYVEEGFRIRFGNGETIDFYADSRDEKDRWMNALSKVMGKPDPGARAQRWTDLVLAREKAGEVFSDDSARRNIQNTDGIEVKDFTSPTARNTRSAAQAQGPTATATSSARPAQGHRKPVAKTPALANKSLSNSPVKAAVDGSKTPPLQPRTGHRARNAVNSTIC